MIFLKNCKVDDEEENKPKSQDFIRICSNSKDSLEKQNIKTKRKCFTKKTLKWIIIGTISCSIAVGIGLVIYLLVPKAPNISVMSINKSNSKDIFDHLILEKEFVIIPMNLTLLVKNPNYWELDLISSNVRLSTYIKEAQFQLGWGQLAQTRIKIDHRSSKEIPIKTNLKLNNNTGEKFTDTVIYNILRFHCNDRRELRQILKLQVDLDYEYQVSNWDINQNHLNWTINWNCNWSIKPTI